jgi:Metal-independent alpha-mannosidase (GH125)
MWLRDSSVQLAIYLPRVAAHPALRTVFEGMLRSQAFYILQVQSDIPLSKPHSLCTQCTASWLPLLAVATDLPAR